MRRATPACAAHPHRVDTPGAADLAHDRTHPMRPDWDAIKDDVMRLAVLHKFVQHADCRETLFGTGAEKIIEATTDDYYWGEGTKQTGKNRLGVILMEVREVFSEERTQIGRAAAYERQVRARLP